jgi:hypothetical protein
MIMSQGETNPEAFGYRYQDVYAFWGGSAENPLPVHFIPCNPTGHQTGNLLLLCNR